MMQRGGSAGQEQYLEAQKRKASGGGEPSVFAGKQPKAAEPQKIDRLQDINSRMDVFATSLGTGAKQPQLFQPAAVGNVQARPVGFERVAGQNIDQTQMNNFLQAANKSGAYTPQSMYMMQQAAQGGGPSAAQSQLQSGVDQAIRAQMAAAGSRGFSAAATRGAQMQGAEMQQAAVNQAAQLRAQEQQAAQQAFLQASLQQEDMARQSALQSGALSLQGATSQAGLLQQAALANQDTALKAGMSTAQFDLQSQLANQQKALAMNDMGLSAQGLQQQGQFGYDQLVAQMLGQRLGSETGIQQNWATINAAANEGERNRRQAMIGALIGGGSALGAAGIAASDRRGKKEIAVNKETESFLSALTDNSYKYKDTSKPGTAPGKQYGPMAQDLMKTDMGKTAVIEGPDGLMVDSGRGFLLALSGLSNIHNRLKALEAK